MLHPEKSLPALFSVTQHLFATAKDASDRAQEAYSHILKTLITEEEEEEEEEDEEEEADGGRRERDLADFEVMREAATLKRKMLVLSCNVCDSVRQ